MMCSFPNMLFEFVVYQVNPFSCLLCSKHEKLALPDLFGNSMFAFSHNKVP